jgi:cyclopropane fatty-acyl-phospholipid synthase-like methyltransferase
MSIGKVARKLLGKRLFNVAGSYYRAVFVDLRKVARAVASEFPKDASVLDVGGGDGAPLNYLLALRSDVRVTMIDLGPSVGQAVREEFRDRIIFRPGTSVRQYVSSGERKPDAVMINDVLHHVPDSNRDDFFRDLAELLGDTGALCIIKDIEPGYFRSRLSLWADKYVSGDKTVSLVSRAEVVRRMSQVLGSVRVRETCLFAEDVPNYALVFQR